MEIFNIGADWRYIEVCPTNNNTTDNAYEINTNEIDTDRDIDEVDDEEDDTDSDNPFLPSEDGREKRDVFGKYKSEQCGT